MFDSCMMMMSGGAYNYFYRHTYLCIWVGSVALDGREWMAFDRSYGLGGG